MAKTDATVPADLQNAAKLKQDIANLEAQKAKLVAETEQIEVRQIMTGGKKPTLAQIKTLSAERKKLLGARLRSRTVYPAETSCKMRMELAAINEERWVPGYKPPKIRTKYDQHMQQDG